MSKEAQSVTQSIDAQKDKFEQNMKIVNAIKQKREFISSKPTPKPFIERKGDGFDYVNEAYMRKQLNEHYPIWSWKLDNSEFLGAEWVIVRGTLSVVDAGVPRTFSSMGAARVQFKRGSAHVAENVVDVDKNVASDNTNAFQRAKH